MPRCSASLLCLSSDSRGFPCVQASVRDRSVTRKWLCCSLRSTMLPRCTSNVCHVFVLVLCLSSAEDFDWTKNDHSSFYYGSFPAGKHLLHGNWWTNTLIVHNWWHWDFGLILIFFSIYSSGFSWGAGSSAYQTEGAWDKDGKGLSIWDVFSHKKGKILQNDTGDSSCEGYHKVRVSWLHVLCLERCKWQSKEGNKCLTCLCALLQDDVSLMKELKLNHYRFSISWPRLIPTGIKCEYMITDMFSLELAGCSSRHKLWSHFQPNMWTKRECSTTTTWSIICWRTTSLLLLLCITGICHR